MNIHQILTLLVGGIAILAVSIQIIWQIWCGKKLEKWVKKKNEENPEENWMVRY